MDIDTVSTIESIQVLTWNVDGLNENSDEDDLLGRTLWIVQEIDRARPHVVFLQELVALSFSIIEQKCKNSFHVFRQVQSDQPYFVAILIHKATMDIVGDPVRVPFPNSQMGREGLFVSAKLKNKLQRATPLIGFLTAHLESLRDYGSERKNQFEICTKFIQNLTNVDFSVFGGDLNARDSDVPKAVTAHDCWVLAGRPPTHQYTWDLTLNKNVSFPNGAQPRCRFDRMYLIPGKDPKDHTVTQFRLIGTEPIPNLRHPSDHFGVLVGIKVT